MLATLLSHIDGGPGGGGRVKCVPSYVAPGTLPNNFFSPSLQIGMLSCIDTSRVEKTTQPQYSQLS